MTSLAAIGRALMGMEKLFGCPLADVDKIIQLMVVGKTPPPPDWIRGCQRMTDLPRASIRPLRYKFPIPLVRDSLIADRLRWIIENTGGHWHMNEDGFSFEDKDAAFHYKMRWL